MPPLKATPLAFESLRVQSSALVIEFDDLKIAIDPAVALAPALYELRGTITSLGTRITGRGSPPSSMWGSPQSF